MVFTDMIIYDTIVMNNNLYHYINTLMFNMYWSINMSDFIQNPWVVGIGGGLISGFVVYMITKFSISKKSNTEYYKQINQANSEVIRILKPYVADNGLPDKDILNAIISAVARKYLIQSDEMYSIQIFCEELIKEIIDNVYVSNDMKKEYFKQLKQYIDGCHIIENQEDAVAQRIIATKPVYKSSLQKQTINMISITTAFITIIASFITIIITFAFNENYNIENMNLLPSSLIEWIAFFLVLILIPITMLRFDKFYSLINKRKKSK